MPCGGSTQTKLLWGQPACHLRHAQLHACVRMAAGMDTHMILKLITRCWQPDDYNLVHLVHAAYEHAHGGSSRSSSRALQAYIIWPPRPPVQPIDRYITIITILRTGALHRQAGRPLDYLHDDDYLVRRVPVHKVLGNALYLIPMYRAFVSRQPDALIMLITQICS